ncbi:SAM-dependent methyltransferase [Marinicella meishanensis]|uniref:SAM-dependent methyltransferase n=1 Tax=Marinicella meishanensis TaxID=2873263 RepID=UPI001CBB6427|nr:cyclopropane-fatty-acyl-phospholipid synthase family protein [Marinicella sp. NBU2979]
MNSTETLVRKTESKPGVINRFIKKQVLRQLDRIQQACLTISDQQGSVEYGDPNADLRAELRLYNDRFYNEVAFQGSIGAAESYIAGDWDCDDLTALIRIFVRNRDLLDDLEGGSARFKNALLKVGHFFNKNTLKGSKKNIAGHYDLGNDLFKEFLDSRMMYSSAIYQTPTDTLEEASERKLKTICEKLDLQADDHVIEIGTGWGGFAIYAAENYGCRITTTTISEEQHDYAQALIREKGLESQITLLKQDYRLLTGTYDKLVSIEMIEAVGHHYLPTYLRKCDELLKPEGMALIQAITIEDHRYEMALKSVDFIKKYIFPGSFIPSVGAIAAANANSTTMKLVNLEDFGESYAHTLRDWHAKFNDNIEAIERAGYGLDFQRMWRFYFCYCEGGFIERAISDVHLLFAKANNRRPALLAVQ